MKRLITAVAAAMLLAGCTTTGSPGGQPVSPTATADSGAHNATDVMFAQMMVAQYGPAAQLVDLAETRTRNEQVRMLAAAVNVTQADEANTVRRWLVDWSEPLTPAAQPDLHAGHGGLPTSADAEMEALRAASDADFDRTFLNLLIAHQHRAVEYARMELAGGAHPGALDLATRINQSRTAQIELMLKLAA